jgi:hypothetical protein
MYTGWSGAIHDQRCIGNSHLYRNLPNYFAPLEVILGDSAYTPHVNIVPCYKKLPNRAMTREQATFNTRIAIVRIHAEHTIGILKGRFPFLKAMGHKLDPSPETMKLCIDTIETCAILHNWLIDDAFDNPDFEKDLNYERELMQYFHQSRDHDMVELSQSNRSKPGYVKRAQLKNYALLRRL